MANIKTGERWIDFNLPGIDGRNYSLADYGGKRAVAVIFSCNHCPYVLAWEDRLIAIQHDYADQDVQLLTINANDAEKYPADSYVKMKEHATEKAMPYPYLHDESQEVARAYGAERTPEVFLFDGQGILQYHGAIDDNYDDPAAVRATYLQTALDVMLAGAAPQPAETSPVGCTIKWK